MTEDCPSFAFNELANGLGTPVLLLSPQGIIRSANQMAANVLGIINSDLMIGRNIASLCLDPAAVEGLLARWSRSNQRTPGLLTFLAPDGRRIECRCAGVAVSRGGSKPNFVLLECQPKEQHPGHFVALNEQIDALRKELSSRRRLEEERAQLLEIEQLARVEAEKASRQKDEFLGMMSHELRTPITTIYGNAFILNRNRSLLSEEDAAVALEDVEREASRLERIIENMLVLARLDTSRAPRAQALSLQEQLESIASSFLHSCTTRKLSLSLDQSTPPVHAVPAYLEMIVTNLLSNADKYSPPDKPIDLRLQRNDRAAIVSVLDEGIGLLPSEEASLFSPFFRSSRVQNSIGGIGLGLSVCKRLVEAQGGSIWASAREKGGSDFSFSLPF